MEPQAAKDVAGLFRLFRDGHRIESVMSGWRLDEAKIAELLLEGWRQGERVETAWVLSEAVRELVLQTLRERPDLGAVEVSSLFRGRVSPVMVRLVREIAGVDRGVQSTIFTAGDFETRLQADLLAASKRVLIVAPEIKGHHFRNYMTALRRLVVCERQVVFFAPTCSELVVNEIRDAGIVIIEQHTHANLLLIDDAILWEGSMNFLQPPGDEEHVRRTVSRLQCDQVRDLHDLYA